MHRVAGLSCSPSVTRMFALAGMLLLVQSAVGADARPLFEDATERVGVNFTHFNGMSGELYFVEMVGAGGALFDYDNDGDLDAYMVQGAMLGNGKKLSDAVFPPKDTKPLDRLYRNDFKESGSLHFTDVTTASGIRGPEYGMGAATGDYDNDGWVDLYVTNYGANRLWHNNGDGTFTDVTGKSGTGDRSWSVSASFVDYDRDGWLDLYVANYVEYDLANNPRCFARSTRRDYCGPATFTPARDRLYRNKGDGTFEDVTTRVLRDYKPAAGLGVVAGDFNGDGRVDIYVANDGYANHLWYGQADGTLRDDGMFSGAAVNRAGRPEASMGVDAGDIDNDGDLDLFMTHLMGETNTLYVNQGGGVFEDRTSEFGLAAPSSPRTGFGTAWIDYDNDGWLDLFIINGAVRLIDTLLTKGDPYPLREPNQLFHNRQGRGFDDVSDRAGPALAVAEVSRGAAFGDVDNDGDTDVLVFNNSGPARLLLNSAGNRNHWLGLRLVDPVLKRDLTGTRIEARRADAPPIWRHVRTDGSYATANDARVLIGLGASDKLQSVRLHWPDGTVEAWPHPEIDRYTILYKGKLGEKK